MSQPGIFAQYRSTAPAPAHNTSSFSSDLSGEMSSTTRKRTRDAASLDEEVEIESATSSFQQKYPKRSRVALARENGGSTVSDDDDEEDRPQMGYGARDERDNESSEPDLEGVEEDNHSDSDSDSAELRATQAVEKEMATHEHRENVPSEEGVIEEVFCRNFMCHTRLTVGLGPLINFIVGHNGSGKSAVLTALTICLGESARKTNRGGNIRDMIKEGEGCATLAVRIRNRGEGAYKPELYGRSITVERNFSRSGNNGYKLKNAENKVVTTKKADLDDMLDYFGLQIDNPINVLTQDLARQFLSSSSPTDKYKFFIRGTRLEELDRDYNVMEENLDKIQAKLASRKEDVPALKTKYEQAEARKKRLEKAEKLAERLNNMKNQHAWAQVAEQEDILERYDREVERAEQSVQERTEEAETVSGTYDGHSQAYETSGRLVENLKQQLVPVEEQRETEREKFRAARAELETTLNGERQVRGHMRKAKDRMKALEADVTVERDRIANAEGVEHAQRLDRLEELKTAVEEAKQQQNVHAERVAELRREKDITFEAYEAAKPSRERQKEEVVSAERQLAGLQRAQGRPFEAYRPNMDQLVRAVDAETRWRQKPVGPMGRHVQLLKPAWGSQIEKTFGAVLESFVVTNTEDQQMLRSIMNRVRCQQPIYIGDPEPLDTTGKEPEDLGFGNILSALDINNTLVRNQLIINQGIDQLVLIPERVVADRILFDGPRPRNVKAAVCFANKRGHGLRLDYSRTGQAKTSQMDAWTGSPRMQTDREQQIRHQRETVDHHKRALHIVEQMVREKQEAMTKADQNVKRGEREAHNLKIAAQQAEDAVQEQKNEIEARQPRDGRLQELERQLQASKDELEAHGSSFQDAVVQKDNHNKLSKEAKYRLDAAGKEYDAGKARLDEAQEKLERMHRDRQDALLAKNQTLEQIDYAKRTVTQLEERRDKQRDTVEDYTTQASRISRRVPVEPGLTLKELDNRIEKFSKDLQNQERAAGGTSEELTLRWQKAKMDYDDAVAQLKTAKEREDKLVSTLAYRRFRWKKFQQYIAYRARFMFKYLLSERNFRGRVLMDHHQKLLDIAVEPDLSKSSDEGREARTLSGGEKSFSTICLLLSIWEAMGSPIRCLDEFDVFMDSVNRATSMNMMIQAARRSVGRQFILITPQSMANVEKKDDVEIFVMKDPERGQTVLPDNFTRVRA